MNNDKSRIPDLLPVDDAIAIVIANCSALAHEKVPLTRSVGRVLAEDIIADSDLPPFDRSQMDGYALRAGDTQISPAKLQIVGESVAGRGWHHEMQPGQAVRIMTGAPVPAGANSVQQVEKTREAGGMVEILEPVAEGRSIVRRGSEITKGETVLRHGERIKVGAVAVLASFGYAEVLSCRQPRVAVLATGTELVGVHQQPAQDQIRDSNNHSIAAFAELAGANVERLPLANDDLRSLAEAVAGAAERADVVITSGGVSMGAYDFTKTALRELGAEIFFERVALRPGKPTVFARLPDGMLVFALPGNPVSVAVSFNLFARPALLAMQGATERELIRDWAVLSRPVKGSIDRESYLPTRLGTDEVGHLLAEPLKWGGSSDFVGFARAEALIRIPAGVPRVEPKTVVQILRLP